MDKNKLNRMLVYFMPYRFRVVGMILCACVASSVWAAYVYLIKPILNDIFIDKNFTLLIYLPLIMIVLQVLRSGANYGRGYLMRYIGQNIIQDVRNQLYGHILHLPLGLYGQYTTGKLMSRVLNDVSMVQRVLSNVIKDLFQQIVTMFFLMGVLFYQDWKLALVAILVLPFTYYPMKRFGKKLRRISHRGQERMGDLSDLLQETFSGIRIVKAFSAEGLETERFMVRNNQYFKNMMKAARISELSPVLMELLGVVGAALVIWFGGYQVYTGSMDPGTFFSFFGGCILMYSPIRLISRANNTIQQSLAAVDRIFMLLDTQSESHSDSQKISLPPFKEEIRFQDMGFVYEGSEVPALVDINLTVKTGETVALVGLSGAGKTTLVNLIPRFFDPSEGSISIDGINIQDVTLASLRNQIGIVSQDTVLFDDTVANNIAYGTRETSIEAIENVAKSAYAHQFIQRMPEGYQTVIGERGARLSGGERQRLAIARALLKNPPLLILDEATSNLDAESEQMIQKALEVLLAGRTTFVIAHRLSTVMNAHRILVIEQGRIKESGRHQDLLRKGGLYRKLYELQFRDTSKYASAK